MSHLNLRLLIPSLLLIALFWLPAIPASAADGTAAAQLLRLIHFNDFHAAYLPGRKTDEEGLPRIGGAAAVGAYIRQLRAERPESLLVFAGDMIQASPLEKATTGESLLQIFNRFAPDVACLGNHEFDYGKARLKELLAMARFPVICANLLDRDSGKVLVAESHIVTTPGGLRVLFIGLYPLAGKSYVEEDQQVQVLDAAESLMRIARERDSEADLTVAVSHIGYDDDLLLSRKLGPTSEVDLIIGGHSHTEIGNIDPTLPVPVTQAFCNGMYLGVIDLEVDPDLRRIRTIQYRLVPTYTDRITPDAEIEAIVQAEVAKMPELFEPIAELAEPLGMESRLGETRLGNFTVDAFVELYGSDLAFMNSKSIRNSLPGPQVNRAEVMDAFPFEGGLYRLEISGDGIIRMLEHYANKKKDRTVFVPHGFFYRYRIAADGEMTVTEARLHGQPLEPEKKYSVIVDDRQAREFERFYGAKIVKQVAERISDEMIHYLQGKKTHRLKPGGRSVRESETGD